MNLRYPLDFESLATHGLHYAFAEALLQEELDMRRSNSKAQQGNFQNNTIHTERAIFGSIKGFPRSEWDRLMKKLYKEGALVRSVTKGYQWNPAFLKESGR